MEERKDAKSAENYDPTNREDMKDIHPLYQWRHENPGSSFVERPNENIFPTPTMDMNDTSKLWRAVKIILIVSVCLGVTAWFFLGLIL